MQLGGKHIALIATDEFEDSELTQPLDALRETGAEVTVVSIKPDTITGKNGTEIHVDALVDDADSSEYHGLVIPGGVGNPDKLRTDEGAVSFVRDFFEQHKPVGAICHGPWLLVEADVVDGRTVTSWPSLKTDLVNAGANWVDEEVVVDEGLVTSRNPDDLPAFCSKIIEEFAEGKHEEQTV
ncbi:DJ-1/PfpI/YhbO family deglycase/protease [Candidatus Mycosynbacter amalyticus]|uniref:DJ-1/PfpI/YhbO family deglycase/protease n=1 Tax=Candidatus Mycosynbacter amalyticus TaxID=2665156 RepID=A0A857MKY8_9BACT|nr:type 1 glutamine amidotransferase domain-containing protein [Candidatus Mycosynbacter amalyticus]QHN43226.1 DJ-1/PfpI/YhbO family deglycase/protease [Candidatus Mycosynbacter amalyticus]